jgi:FtsZ-interacting cell division protein YlmF
MKIKKMGKLNVCPYYLTILGGSLKKIANKITTRVPNSRNVYTNASID